MSSTPRQNDMLPLAYQVSLGWDRLLKVVYHNMRISSHDSRKTNVSLRTTKRGVSRPPPTPCLTTFSMHSVPAATAMKKRYCRMLLKYISNAIYLTCSETQRSLCVGSKQATVCLGAFAQTKHHFFSLPLSAMLCFSSSMRCSCCHPHQHPGAVQRTEHRLGGDSIAG